MKNIAKYKYFIYIKHTTQDISSIEIEIKKAQFLEMKVWLINNTKNNDVREQHEVFDFPYYEITSYAGNVGDTLYVLMKTKEVK